MLLLELFGLITRWLTVTGAPRNVNCILVAVKSTDLPWECTEVLYCMVTSYLSTVQLILDEELNGKKKKVNGCISKKLE